MASVTTPGNVEFITTPDRLEALCDTLVNEPFYAIDTEFHRERTYWPKLALLQFGWADQVALVDPLAVDPVGLSRLFASDAVAVAHAAEQDLGILMSATGVVPATVFDTQIAAGFLGMSSPSLSRLVDALLGISLPKTDQLSDWLVRPLPASQLTYAASDVEHLLTLRSVMVSRLEQLQGRGRDGHLQDPVLVLDLLGDDPGRAQQQPFLDPRRGVLGLPIGQEQVDHGQGAQGHQQPEQEPDPEAAREPSPHGGASAGSRGRGG